MFINNELNKVNYNQVFNASNSIRFLGRLFGWVITIGITLAIGYLGVIAYYVLSKTGGC